MPAKAEEPMMEAGTDAVAYLYKTEDGSKELVFNCNGEHARRLLELGYTEIPLFAQPSPKCPSCGGLNTSCPKGCGRDPVTGELDGTDAVE